MELWVPSAPHAGEMSRPGERWPIVLAMRNWGFYLAVVAALSLSAISAELAAQGHLNERGKAFAAKSVASMLAG